MIPWMKFSSKSTEPTNKQKRVRIKSEKMLSCVLTIIVLTSVTTVVDGTIKVISVNENETVYTIQERSLILRSSDGLEGILVKSSPLNACTKIKPPPDMNATFVNWILLATWQDMGDPCPLLKKVRNAEDAGYSAIVIQTTPGNESDFIPVSDWYGISIYPCIITYEDGLILGMNYTGEDYVLKFEDEQINTWLGFFIASVLVILAILLAIGLSYVIVQMFVLILLWIRETIINTVQQRRRDRRRRLPASQLKKIPTQQWTTDIPQDTCTICLDTFAVDDRVRILPCSHVFHMICIDPWLLNQRRKCPNCKGKIVFPDERYDSDTSTEDERTPLLRSGSSVERDHTQVFTFNEHVVSHHQPAYTAIHRIFDEAGNLPRPLDEPAGPLPSTSASSISGNKQTAASASATTLTCGQHPNSSQSLPRGTRFSRFVQKFGKHPPPAHLSDDGTIQPAVHTAGSPPNSSRSSQPESHQKNRSHLQGIDNEGLSVAAINLAEDDEVILENENEESSNNSLMLEKAYDSSINESHTDIDTDYGNQGNNLIQNTADNATDVSSESPSVKM